MKKLSTAFKVVGTLAIISAVLCGATFLTPEAEDQD